MRWITMKLGFESGRKTALIMIVLGMLSFGLAGCGATLAGAGAGRRLTGGAACAAIGL